jgi:uncharacterized protein DUF2442
VILHVTDLRYVRDHILWIRFNDGLEGEVDLKDELHGEVFEPLRDPTVFACASLNQDFGVVEWPNGADLAPEFLHERVRVAA